MNELERAGLRAILDKKIEDANAMLKRTTKTGQDDQYNYWRGILSAWQDVQRLLSPML